LDRAREAISKGEHHFREAAEHIAYAHAQGASQREIGKTIEKSVGWVNTLLRWREKGYAGTPFGPGSKASRDRQRDVHSAERRNKREVTEAERLEHVRAQAAKADAARAKAEASKARAEAARARSEARSARDRLKQFEREVFGEIFAPTSVELDLQTRSLLVKALGMLGSDQTGEVANAAGLAEKLRRKLGITWNELIVSALEPLSAAA